MNRYKYVLKLIFGPWLVTGCRRKQNRHGWLDCLCVLKTCCTSR